MFRRSQQLASGGFIAAVLLAPAASRAQSDISPALPNVLILLDTSGSMERKPNATLPAHPVGTTSTTEKTRWVQALEVLGGSLEGYKLLHQPRNTADFRDEFGLGGQAPYDYDYYLPHFRPLSNDCAIGSTSLSTTKTWPADWKTWGTSSFGFRSWLGASLGTVGSCGPTDYRTDGLGILDTFRDQARFGLMTFDTTPDPKTGWTGSAHDPVGGMTGTWSYHAGWDGTGTYSPTYGWPAGCKIDPGSLSSYVHELGARNPSAPPWEGPLVPFADDDSTTALRTVNDRIRYAMLAMRPYGATPLGPMLADAQHYLWNDPKGPKIDPKAACRGNFIILITDGFPNSDLRPNCENSSDPKAAATWPGCDSTTGGGGCCPNKRPQDITKELANPTDSTKPPIKTFVVGFALSDDMGTPVDCNAIDPKSGICASSTLDPKYRPCCTLHEMAFNGGTEKALLANDTDTLRAALVDAMSKATASTSTSRTVPVFSPAASSAGGGQYEFRSSFKVNAFGPWTGVLERIRWECRATTTSAGAVAVDLDAAKGDDYSVNLNKMAARNFVTWDIVSGGGGAKSGDTIRPYLPSTETDGMSTAGLPVMVAASGSTFVNNVSPAMMNITTPCADTTTTNDCRTKLMNYALALPQPKPTWQSRVGIALGDIYHATPVTVGPPSSFLRDESYTAFRNTSTIAARPPFMLTATNDGLLHAFKASVTSDSDSEAELFAFIPPAVLPHIGKQYGGAHALLLDASPVVKDVAFGLTSLRPWGRTSADARGGSGKWRSIAVGGLTTGRGYYALDVTDPRAPKMLWQITKWNQYSGGAASGEDLFGLLPGQPAIGTIFLDDGGVKVETPVAFLPGGEGTRFAPDTCARWPRTTTTPTDPLVTPRTRVRCWTGPGASFTIVRLYDGKILRTFRNDPTPSDGVHPNEPNSATSQIVAAGKAGTLIQGEAGVYPTIDSPITGAVALYPGSTGSVTTRAFVGDQDGTLWKLDVSDPKSERWTFQIFHDPYFPSDSANTNDKAWSPIAIPPVLSVDRFGDVVVNYATGDQNNFSTTYLNHVYSITERTSIGAGGVKLLTPKMNWHMKLTGGVTPTGSLSLFGGNLFFSTFTPDVSGSDACLKGQGVLWGVDYLETEADKVVNSDGTPVPRGRHTKKTGESLTTATCPPTIPNSDARLGFDSFFRCIQLPPGSIIFGAGITQRPSCVTEPSSSIGIDPYTGVSSSHTGVSDVAVGEFQLVAQTGPKAGGGSSGSLTNTYTRTLTPPLSTSRIDSWAAIIE